MAYNPQRLKRLFVVLSSIFKKQPAFGTALADADLDERHNCTVTFEDVVERETVRDCGGEDVVDEETNTQLKRVRLAYPSITAQRLYGWIVTFLSTAAGATGTAANEVQTITSDADGGAAPFTFAFEGLSSTTPALAHNITAANFKKALEALESIGEGQITSVTGANLAAGFAVTFGGRLAKTNVPLITIGNGFTKTASVPTNSVIETTPGGNKYHAATRSTDDQLAKTSMGSGYEGNTSYDAEKWKDLVVESISITPNRRKLLTAEITLLGRFTPEQMEAFDDPDCVILPGLKGEDCKVKVNGEFLLQEFWDGTIILNNAVPTGDDAFPYSGPDIANPERGDQPSYPLTMQILGSEGDTIWNLIKNKTKVPIEFLLGVPGNRCSLIFPNVLMKFASNPKTYVGDKRRSAHNIEATPHKDATLQSPFRAEAYLDQTEDFLSV